MVIHTLKEVKHKDTVSAVRLHGEEVVKRRITDTGIAKRAEVYVHEVAPLGDPVEVNVRGYELSLRKTNVEMVGVQQGLFFFR